MHYQFADLYEALCDANPTAEALYAGAVAYTRVQLDERANRLAHYLRNAGVAPGDHVGVYAYNRAEWVEALLACWKIRACAVNINYRYVGEELRYLWQNAKMVALVYEKAFAREVDALRAEHPALKTYLWLNDETPGSAPSDTPYEVALEAQPSTRGFPERSDDDLHVVYTGGTTGMPKCVQWRHYDLFHNVVRNNEPSERPEDILACANLEQPRRTLTLSPLMHGGGQFAMYWALFNGGVATIAVSHSLNPDEVLTLIGARKIAILNIIGDAMARPIAEAQLASKRDVSSLMVVSSGGAILTEPARALLKQAFGERLHISGGIGGSEIGAAAREASSNGSTTGPRFTPAPTMAVLNDGLRVVEKGGEGDLAIRGFIPLGYYNDPVKTAQVFRTDPEGVRWVLAGDRARVEEDGTFTLLGRDSLCINSGGEKIFVEEVERAVALHPAVRFCAVVGVPDPKWQQRVAAVIELQPGASLSLKELQEHSRQHIAGYKIPRELVLAEFRRTPNGKVDHLWAREHALAQLQNAL